MDGGSWIAFGALLVAFLGAFGTGCIAYGRLSERSRTNKDEIIGIFTELRQMASGVNKIKGALGVKND